MEGAPTDTAEALLGRRLGSDCARGCGRWWWAAPEEEAELGAARRPLTSFSADFKMMPFASSTGECGV